MNPFAIEDVAVNSRVSEFVNQTRYSGGVAGLGQCLPARRRLSGLGAVSLQLMRPEWHGKCPSGSSPGPVAASGNQYCIPDVSAQTVTDSEPKYSASFKTPDGGEAKSSFDIWKPGKLVTETTAEAETSGGGGGFFSSIMDAAGKMFTGAANPQQGYLPPPEKESSPWPWVVGGVAVLGIGAFIFTRSKK